jgi:hypothetical protein
MRVQFGNFFHANFSIFGFAADLPVRTAFDEESKKATNMRAVIDN